MSEFWIVCALDQYYPNGGIDDIIGVFTDKEKAENFLTESKSVGKRDAYEIYSSYELPWIK